MFSVNVISPRGGQTVRPPPTPAWTRTRLPLEEQASTAVSPPDCSGLPEPLPGWRSSDRAGPQLGLRPINKRTSLFGVEAIREDGESDPRRGFMAQGADRAARGGRGLGWEPLRDAAKLAASGS